MDKGVISIPENFNTPAEGLVFSSIIPKIPYAVSSRIPQGVTHAMLIISAVFLILIVILLIRINKKYAVGLVIFISFISLLYVVSRISNPLYVSQTEVDALTVLKKLNSGNVLLYDKDCLKCNWSTEYKPAAMEGRKNYVEEISGKQIIYSLDFVLAKSPDAAKQILKDLKIRYIYLAKYEDYVEALSFNPKDIDVEKVYENANGVIYEII